MLFAWLAANYPVKCSDRQEPLHVKLLDQLGLKVTCASFASSGRHAKGQMALVGMFRLPVLRLGMRAQQDKESFVSTGTISVPASGTEARDI